MSWNTHIPKFRRFVLQNFPFIEEDFDALTDYELICKVVEYLNKVIDSQNAIVEEVESFETNITADFTRLEGLFNELKSYVDNYFDNLDVQEEINNKLDDMVESGTLQEIIADYLNSKAIFGYDTVADMKLATNLISGSFAETLGFYNINDLGSARYKIRTLTNADVVDESTLISLNDPDLVAELIVEDSMNILQFGITPSSNDLDDLMQNAFDKTQKIILAKNQTYSLDGTLHIHGNFELNLNGSTLSTVDKHLFYNFQSGDEFLAYNGNGNINIHNGRINGGGLSLIHGENITIEKVTFSNCYNDHIIELCGCKNVTINECNFNGSPNPIATGTNFSAINLDTAEYEEFPWFNQNNPTYDHTPNKNVYITNNTFDFTGTAQQFTDCRCVDAHTYDISGVEIPTSNDNIVITNNMMKENRGVVSSLLYKCDNVTFSDNTVECIRYGVGIGGTRVRIYNNTFINKRDNQASTIVWFGQNAFEVEIYSNASYMINGGSQKEMITMDGRVTSYSFRKLDFNRVAIGTYAPDSEIDCKYDYTQFNSIFIGIGTGAHLQTIVLPAYSTRTFQTGDGLYATIIEGTIKLTFQANNKILYTNTDPDISQHPSYANIRWISFGKDNIQN